MGSFCANHYGTLVPQPSYSNQETFPMLKIAVSSKAVLDMSVPCEIYRSHEIKEQAQQAFDKEMVDRRFEALPEGPMLPLIKALQSTGLVEVSLVSKISPEAGARVNISLLQHGIHILKQTYANGPEAFRHIEPVHAYLSCDEADVKSALDQGIPAAFLLPKAPKHGKINEIRIAVDFDGFTASDESDKIAVEQGLETFFKHEIDNAQIPIAPGLFTPFVKALSDLRKELLKNPEGIQLKLALITARGPEAKPRAQHTLQNWGIEFDKEYFLEGGPKGPAADDFKAQLFFDDTRRHCEHVSEYAISGHAIHGVANKNHLTVKHPLRLSVPPSIPDLVITRVPSPPPSPN
jgi:5'-nucleotidase